MVIGLSGQYYFLNTITLPNEYIDYHTITMSEYLNLYYLNYHPKFDYLNGLWLMFTGIMMFGLMFLFEYERINTQKKIP
jgi:hypothetical protein